LAYGVCEHGYVFPTCVGVFLQMDLPVLGTRGIPHVCGGVSSPYLLVLFAGVYSPRVWGCFQGDVRDDDAGIVFPTCVGVFPLCIVRILRKEGIPHVCVGVSFYEVFKTRTSAYSPRVWGCFQPGHIRVVQLDVFPTCVGVFLSWPFPLRECCGIPHVCGGVSFHPWIRSFRIGYSPRVWGCFSLICFSESACVVFPTCVGVFPHKLQAADKLYRIPHVCGGVSAKGALLIASLKYSPRVCGCF